MPIRDDSEEDSEAEDVSQHEDDIFLDQGHLAISTDRPMSETHEDNSLPSSPTSQEAIVEVETSPEPSFPPSSPFSAPPVMNQHSIITNTPPSMYPMRLSVATPVQAERSPSTSEFQDETDTTPKRGGESTWDRVKASFTRSNSNNGRRSRTNSLSARDRRYNTDSSISRESGASLGSAKHDKSDGVFSQQQQQSQQTPLMQTPSASGSILSLAPHPGLPPSGVSPIPPATPADISKYSDSKLFPFPGMKQLEEQRRARGINASSPDIAHFPSGSFNGIEPVASSGSSSSATTRSPATARDRRLSHQRSDSQLLARYHNITTPPDLASAPSSASQDYFSVQPISTTPTPTSNGSAKLPTTREGVKHWLKLRMFPSQSSSSSSTNTSSSPPATDSSKSRNASKKPSLSDLLTGRRDVDWEEVRQDDSRTPTGTNGNARHAGPITVEASKSSEMYNDSDPPHASPQFPSRTDSSPLPPPDPQIRLEVPPYPYPPPDYATFPSPSEPPSTTPDPQSSLSEYPTRSTSESFSSMSSRHSPEGQYDYVSKATLFMERLEDILGRNSKNSELPSDVEIPPRKLILSSHVLQVANANTVKDRFLFLFSDILIVAKPIMHDQEALLDSSRPSPLDRKYIIKSVVPLREMKFSADRDESRIKTTALNSNLSKHPMIRTFVNAFSKDPENAVYSLFEKSKTRTDPAALGQLLFRTVDIDRLQLGDYLAQRTSKVILKSFLDEFGFMELPIEKALRAFLLSICLPQKPGTLEYLLDTFSSRWYEANARSVAYDRDVAVRLVRAIVQLNDVMHGGIAQTPGITGYPKRNVLTRDFVEAFRRVDRAGTVSEDLLNQIYSSVRRERLSQARNPNTQSAIPEVMITVKRSLPLRLTYRIQSDPIILRIPQPDPQLTIQLFGKDLLFEPSVLNFEKSSEVSFRVTGSSLGQKTIVMLRTGPNASAYTGLPLSSPLIVERAFMRSTFQLAFNNHEGQKRKYMFSVEDPMIRHPWTTSIQRQIHLASTQACRSSKALQAAEQLAFQVLQDTLIGTDLDTMPSPRDEAFAALTGQIPPRRSRGDGSSSHVRSKSRSQVYHRQGPGQLEPGSSSELDGLPIHLLPSTSRTPSRLWSGRDVEVICQQNSSIPQLLVYLLDVPKTDTPPS